MKNLLRGSTDPESLSGMTMVELEAELKAVKTIIVECETDAAKTRLRKYYTWMRDRIQAEIDARNQTKRS